MSDYYTTLQVTRDADPEVIERAYKALCRKYHPDRRPQTERSSSTATMQQINEAYHVLRDADSRKRYDATLPAATGEHAWDVFWERGLWGMFVERYGTRG